MVLDLFFSLITDFIFISLFRDGKIIKSVYENNHCLHSENFVNKLAKLLKDENVFLNEINNIFFLSGPGGQTGERVSFSFVTSMKILNQEVKVFFLDSLSFQSNFDSNCLSAISVGENTKKYYVNIYKDGNILLNKEKIEKFEFYEIVNDFKDFRLMYNFKDVDFPTFFLNLKDKFLCFNEVY